MNDDELMENLVRAIKESRKLMRSDKDMAIFILGYIKSNRIEWLEGILPLRRKENNCDCDVMEGFLCGCYVDTFNDCLNQILENAKKDNCERHCTREIIEGCGECKHINKRVGKIDGEDLYLSEG